MKLIDLRENLVTFLSRPTFYGKDLGPDEFDNAMRVCKDFLHADCICIPHACIEPDKLNIDIPNELLFLEALEYRPVLPVPDQAKHDAYVKELQADPVFMAAWEKRCEKPV